MEIHAEYKIEIQRSKEVEFGRAWMALKYLYMEPFLSKLDRPVKSGWPLAFLVMAGEKQSNLWSCTTLGEGLAQVEGQNPDVDEAELMRQLEECWYRCF